MACKKKKISIDDEIYEDFKNSFPNFAVDVIDEDAMKSDEGKNVWREWITKYEKKVNDYNFGTLVRKDAKGDYTKENTIFGKRKSN